MKIFFKSDNKPLQANTSEGSVLAQPDSRLYINLDSDTVKPRRRHDGELVMRNGWIHLDYDEAGYIVGLELVEGDPVTGVTECIPYLQPINPMIN